jgi:hypothetical protein
MEKDSMPTSIKASASALVIAALALLLFAISLPGQTFTGKLTWIAAEVDEKSRMARARAEVANADGLLKAKMFARARIVTGSAEKAVLVVEGVEQVRHLQQVVQVGLVLGIGLGRRIGVGGHAVKGKWGDREGMGGVEVHILAESIGVEQEGALLARGRRRQGAGIEFYGEFIAVKHDDVPVVDLGQ